MKLVGWKIFFFFVDKNTRDDFIRRDTIILRIGGRKIEMCDVQSRLFGNHIL